jgi:type I restriction enzyme S subunit
MTKLFDKNFIATDPELKNILSNPKLNTVPQWLERLWEIYEPFADKNFRIEIAKKLHQRFWEMYLTCSLLELQYEIEAQTTEKGPDICIHQNGRRIWIEAIAPEPGNGDDAVPPIELNARTWTFYTEPENQIILRYRSALRDKLCKYTSYVGGGTIQKDEPYIIALNGSKVHSSSSDGELPYIVKSLFPLGNQSVSIDFDSNILFDTRYAYRSGVTKRKGADISTSIFLGEEFVGVSGVLYSSASCLNHSASTSDNFMFVHNPNATNPVPREWFSTGREFWVEDNLLHQRKLPTEPMIA